MGITIHYEGRLKNEHSYSSLMRIVKDYVEHHQWEYKIINEPSGELFRYSLDTGVTRYNGPVKGIVVYPHEDSETFSLKFDTDLYMQSFVKTQFAPVHIYMSIVVILQAIQPLFESFTVHDEGGYLDTESEEVLTNRIKTVEFMIDVVKKRLAGDSE